MIGQSFSDNTMPWKELQQGEVGTLTSNRLEPKYLPFYASMNIMGKISHSYLIDGGACSNLMSKIIMELLNLSCNEGTNSKLMFNKMVQPTIGQIKYLTIFMCAHPWGYKINFEVVDMDVENYYIILGWEWKPRTSGYNNLYGTHMMFPDIEKILSS